MASHHSECAFPYQRRLLYARTSYCAVRGTRHSDWLSLLDMKRTCFYKRLRSAYFLTRVERVDMKHSSSSQNATLGADYSTEQPPYGVGALHLGGLHLCNVKTTRKSVIVERTAGFDFFRDEIFLLCQKEVVGFSLNLSYPFLHILAELHISSLSV